MINATGEQLIKYMMKLLYNFRHCRPRSVALLGGFIEVDWEWK